MRIAIMQPYFFPYIGYFRLIALSDIFIVLDNVQFQRRGWIHRNKFTKVHGGVDWLSLPIVKGNRDETQIKDVKFRDSNFGHYLNPFILSRYTKEIEEKWPNFFELNGNLLDYLELTIKSTSQMLGLSPNILRSSQIGKKENLSGQEYIIKLCKILGATTYINAPGGRSLYSEQSFANYGVELKFLDDYRGFSGNCLERIIFEDINLLKLELNTYCVLSD